MRYETITVTCMGCLNDIDRPSDADMELFRIGIHIHKDREDCYEAVEYKLHASSPRQSRIAVEGSIRPFRDDELIIV